MSNTPPPPPPTHRAVPRGLEPRILAVKRKLAELIALRSASASNLSDDDNDDDGEVENVEDEEMTASIEVEVQGPGPLPTFTSFPTALPSAIATLDLTRAITAVFADQSTPILSTELAQRVDPATFQALHLLSRSLHDVVRRVTSDVRGAVGALVPVGVAPIVFTAPLCVPKKVYDETSKKPVNMHYHHVYLLWEEGLIEGASLNKCPPFKTYFSDTSVRWDRNLTEKSGATNSATASRHKVLVEKMDALLQSRMAEGVSRADALLWVTDEMIRIYGKDKQKAYSKILKEKKNASEDAAN